MITSNAALYRAKEHSLSLLLIVSISVAFFSSINFQLLSIGFYDHINIAFDFDQAWFFDMLAYPPDAWKHRVAQDTAPLLIKHPFIYLYRFPCQLLQHLGVNPELSVVLLSLMFHTGTLVLSYFIFLKILESPRKATFMTWFMMLSSTYLANGIVLDTYVLAGFWITCCFSLYLKELTEDSLNTNWLKILVYVMAIGTTTYLLLLVLLLEISLVWSKKAKHDSKELIYYLFQGVIKSIGLFFILFCLCYYQNIISILSDPVGVIKRTLWAVARPGEKEGIISIINTFVIHTFVAPFHSIIMIEKDISMADFRNGGYHFLGYILILPLLVLHALSFKTKSPLLFVSIAWLMITMMFHVEYQDRGSLFLYTGHTMLASSIVIALGLRAFNVKVGWILPAFLIVFLGYNNIQSIYSAIESVLF